MAVSIRVVDEFNGLSSLQRDVVIGHRAEGGFVATADQGGYRGRAASSPLR